MNYHSDEWIMERVRGHYEEALEYFSEDRIVGIFLQGSQNYGLDTPNSDIDTKLIVVPTIKEIATNEKPVSTTYIRGNNEHTDWKDIRLYIDCFKKCNLNFLEILFTKYKIINPMYETEWVRLIESRENIARYDVIRAIKSMTGMAHTKYSNLEHTSPAADPYIKKFSYVPKELCHLLRIEEYISRYINEEPYENCMISRLPDFLKSVKDGSMYDLKGARRVADASIRNVDEMREKFIQEKWDVPVDENAKDLLASVQYDIIYKAVSAEIEKGSK